MRMHNRLTGLAPCSRVMRGVIKDLYYVSAKNLPVQNY
jgi:hypothetical protein